jgi:hypothetical protein
MLPAMQDTPSNGLAEVESALEKLTSQQDFSLRPFVADELRNALLDVARTTPKESVRTRLLQLLDEGTVDFFVDSRDFPCRAAIIEALSMKETWARELTPADRELLRRALALTNNDGGGARTLALLLAVMSLLWSAPWLVMFAMVGLASPAVLFIALPFLLAAVHAVKVLIGAAGLPQGMTRIARLGAKSELSRLGWWWVVGPLAASIAFVISTLGMAFCVLLFAAPAMLTAFSCFLVAARIAPHDHAVSELLLLRRPPHAGLQAISATPPSGAGVQLTRYEHTHFGPS